MYVRRYAGKWRVEVNKHGHSVSKLCETQREAHDWGLAKEAELESLKKGKGATFGAAVQYYLRNVSPKKKEGAAEWEARRFANMEEFFGIAMPLAKITRARIAEWRDWRLKTVAGSTVEREANLLRNLFRKARIEWEWINHNPFEGVQLPTNSDPRELVWTWRDIRRVLRYCQASSGAKTQQVGIAFHIALRTAMRLKEVFLAKKEGVLAVIDDSKTTRKGRRVTIPLTYQGRRVMDRYKDIKWVVAPNEASVLFNKACVQCGVRIPGEDGVTFHDSRATALTSMARKMPVEKLQRISRHKDINILVSTYYRATNEQIAQSL
jgi:integrase